jgi:hypothetical protein
LTQRAAWDGIWPTLSREGLTPYGLLKQPKQAMAQALDPTAYVHQGFWRNLGKPSSESLTLTLSPTNATILTNALALFVAMSGGQLWTIIRFTLHQIRAASRSQRFDMTHNQQQIVLRNATTDVATARLMLNLAWASRENAKKAMATCITIVILAILNATLFMAAGTFSNTLVDAGPPVLSRSPHCGLWNQSYLDIASNGANPTSESNFELSVEFIAKQIHDVQASLEYAHNCYMTELSQYRDPSCGTYLAPRLNWTTVSNASCPFGDELCSEISPTIELDTGILDSHWDLGINALQMDRLGYRRVTTCTVLNDTRHTTNWIKQNDSSSWAYANFGPSLLYTLQNTTYSYSNFADFFTDFTGAITIPYQVNAQVAYQDGVVADPLNEGFSFFDPIAGLMRSDADTSLIFLSFIGKYTGPVEDPWFSAHTLSLVDNPLPLVAKQYARDRPISTLGCTEQYQMCTGDGKCTPLLGLNQVQESFLKFDLSANQVVTFDRLMKANAVSSVSWIVQNLAFSTMPLLAINVSATQTHTLSLPVPDNQWQIEVGYWHSVAMSQLQRTLTEYGTGQISPNTDHLIPARGADATFCRNIMIQSTVYSSFNVVALAVLISFGTLIIVTSLMIERLSSWIQIKWNRGRYGRQMWKDHDMLGFQLKRGRGASLPSTNGSMPSGQQQIFDRGVQMGIMSPSASRYYPSGFTTGMSPKRASSQALSPADTARQFPGWSARPTPSPVRSTFTADFVFDFGPNTGPIPHTQYDGFDAKEKPLPEVPDTTKQFCIDRGTADVASDCSGSVDCTGKPMEEVATVDGPAPPQPQHQQEKHVENLHSAGPGRWAYYSAHKRRYGPKLTVPSPTPDMPSRPPLAFADPPHLVFPSPPHIAMSSPLGLRGGFGDRNQGNWI